jgi:hypothetical protein
MRERKERLTALFRQHESARPPTRLAPDGWAGSAAGRRVLERVVRTAPTANPDRRTKIGWRPVLRWSFLRTGLVGAAAAAVLAVSAILTPLGERTGTPPGAADGGTETATARDILLAAATQAERAPATTGKYWHVKTLDVYGPERVGGPNGYEVLRRSVNESWDASDPREASWTGYRELGVRLRSDGDERAWRAAGSPTEWTLVVDGANTVTLSMKPRAGELTKDKDGEKPHYMGDLWRLSLEQVRAMPDEPDALRAWATSRLQTIVTEQAAEMGTAIDSTVMDHMVFSTFSRLLVDTPASPRVRATAFRVLADIDGVRGLGTVQDESGRPGQGVEISDGTTTVRLIVDASTHTLLGTKTISTPAGATLPVAESGAVLLAAEWSDAAPQVPTLPQE